MRILATLLMATLLGTPAFAAAKSGKSGSVSVKGYTTKDGHYVAPHTRAAPGHGGSSEATTHHDATAASSTTAAPHNRSPAQKDAFRKNSPCPSTGSTTGACPGYEVDHVNPLACGGADSPGNMQWLTKDDNRHKGAAGCAKH